jgi:hypothetical protein
MVEADSKISSGHEEPAKVEYVSDDDEMFANLGGAKPAEKEAEKETDAEYPDNMEFGEVPGIEPET